MFRRPRTLSEAECYARCYADGDRGVRVTRVVPRSPEAFEPRLSGEELRRLFERRLDAREPEAA